LRVIFHYAASADLARRLAGFASRGLEISVVPPDDDASFVERLPGCEALWHVLKPVNAALIQAAPALRLIQKMGSGLDTIDLVAAKSHGVAVCNLPGSNAQAVSEMTLGLMLAVLRKTAQFDRETRSGKGWEWPADRQSTLGEISDKTVGLIGYGATASRLAPVLVAMGAQVLYTARKEVSAASGRYVALDQLLARSHIVSLHLPLTDETRGMIGRAQMARMRKGAFLINTSRGGLVDQEALVDALRSGHLSGAGLDTFAKEPVDIDNPLLALENVVVTPHVAWLTLQTFERSFELMAENCRRLQAGEDLIFRVV
jgi:phosphoglycerate dehydrogenase-like enzyme